MHKLRGFLLLLTLAAEATTPVLGQTKAPSIEPASAASIPDFSGLWAHPYFPGFEPPTSGPGPVTNRSRLTTGPSTGAGNFREFVGDYSNPILKPQAAEVLKKFGEISRTGVTYPTPSNQCWPNPLPYIFWNLGIQLLQQRDKITILYEEDHEIRRVRMNASHPAQLAPSWYGDSVGRYEDDVLVIDTVGIKADRPFAMLDMYGTPYTKALHVVERYRLIDYEAAKVGLAQSLKENINIGRGNGDAPLRIDANYRGKYLQLQFTVEDEGTFTMPWSATITYGPGINWRGSADWHEVVCAENSSGFIDGTRAAVPIASKPDF